MSQLERIIVTLRTVTQKAYISQNVIVNLHIKYFIKITIETFFLYTIFFTTLQYFIYFINISFASFLYT